MIEKKKIYKLTSARKYPMTLKHSFVLYTEVRELPFHENIQELIVNDFDA